MTVINHWESWGDFLDKVRVQNPDVPDSVAFRAVEHPSEKYNWYGATATMDEAIQLATQGWQKGEKTVRQITARLFSAVAARMGREDFVPDVTGLFFDVPSVIRGTPDAWYEIELRDGEGSARRHVPIIYNVGVSHSVPTNVILARGSAVAALVELLEYGGCAVSLDVCDAARNIARAQLPHWITTVRIKQAGQPLELARLAFSVAHPATARRLFFSAMEHEQLKTRQAIGATGAGGYYGIPADVPESLRSDPDSIYVGAMCNESGRDWQDPREAERWIIEQLRNQGLTIEDYKGGA